MCDTCFGTEEVFLSNNFILGMQTNYYCNYATSSTPYYLKSQAMEQNRCELTETTIADLAGLDPSHIMVICNAPKLFQ